MLEKFCGTKHYSVFVIGDSVAILLRIFVCVYLASVGAMSISHADSDKVKTGKKAADKYFSKRSKPSTGQRSPDSSAGAPRYLGLQIGVYVDEETYKWGKSNKDDVAKFNLSVTYRIGEWTDSMDLSIRSEFTTFEVDDKKPFKWSIMPLVTFPDAKSGFPLYFGAGAGAGIFFKQAEEESALSFDYQIIGGVRFFNLINSTGFNFEFGIKNHIHLLSDGQHNGVFGALGAVFTF